MGRGSHHGHQGDEQQSREEGVGVGNDSDGDEVTTRDSK